MWFILIILAALAIYFNFFYQKESKKQVKRETTRQPGKKSIKTNNAANNWIFQRQIDEPGVPPIINTYRKHLNGYTFKRLMKNFKNIETIEDEIQRNIAYLQFVEPIAELERNGMFDDYDEILFPSYNMDHLYPNVLRFLNEYSPVIGANGQLKNLEDIGNFIPELSDAVEEQAYIELKARNEIISIIKKNGFIYRTDLFELESFKAVHLQEYLINRLISYGQIEKDKKGKFLIYKLIEKSSSAN
jgi:hypothetical protein